MVELRALDDESNSDGGARSAEAVSAGRASGDDGASARSRQDELRRRKQRLSEQQSEDAGERESCDSASDGPVDGDPAVVPRLNPGMSTKSFVISVIVIAALVVGLIWLKIGQEGWSPESALLESYFDDLELPYTATVDDVRTAYKRLARKWHPDKGTDCPSCFERVATAYEVLKEQRNIDRYRELKGMAPVSTADAGKGQKKPGATATPTFTHQRRIPVLQEDL